MQQSLGLNVVFLVSHQLCCDVKTSAGCVITSDSIWNVINGFPGFHNHQFCSVSVSNTADDYLGNTVTQRRAEWAISPPTLLVFGTWEPAEVLLSDHRWCCTASDGQLLVLVYLKKQMSSKCRLDFLFRRDPNILYHI